MADLSAASVGESPGGKTMASSTSPSISLPDRADNPSSSRSATSKTSTKLKSRIMSPIKNIFRRQASPANQGAPGHEIAPDKGPGNPSIPVPVTLISPGFDRTSKEEAVSPARKVGMYDKAILVVNIFEKAVNLAEIALPSGVGDTLEMLVNVLEVLKQMVENEEAWKALLLTLDDHRKQFNDQIILLKQENVKPDSSSPLLEPLGRYSEALRRITAKVINDSGLMQGNLPETSAWSKIKNFVTRYREARSEQGKIQGYHDELLAAMRDLMQGLVTYTAFEVRNIGLQVDRIAEVIVGRPVSKRKVKAKAPPHVTPFHVQREAEWKLMMHHLVHSDIPGQKIFAITGMGGCGKTQLVAYFLRQNKDTLPNVVYVDASSEASIKADLQTWAQSLGNGHEQDEWEDGLRLLADSPLDGRCAYILDNADDPQLTPSMFLPDSDVVTVTVIITSRNRLVGNLATTCHLQMGKMTDDEALATLLQAARRQLPIPPEELESARALIKEMGGLALALVQAGAYCHSISSQYSFSQYLSLFHSKRADLMESDQLFPLDKYVRGVYTTLNVSYDAMSAEAREFFHLTSYFRRSDIPVAMLAAAAEQHFEDPEILLSRPKENEGPLSRLSAILCKDGSWDQIRTGKFIQTLHSFSLVSTTVADNGSLFLQYHPLVEAWIRDMPSSDAGSYLTMATQIITSCCTKNNIAIYRYLLPHIIEVLEDNKRMNLHVNDQTAFAVVLMEVGRYYTAELLLEDILKSSQQVPGNETERIASRLAILYTYQGRFAEAQKLQLEVLEKWTKILGADHPDTISAANNLANSYHEQGWFAEAEKLTLEVLEKRKKILGADHPYTITAANNLGTTYHEQGRFAEAEKLKLEVLERGMRILGPDHPKTISAVNNLAVTYYEQRRFAEAEKLMLEVLEKRTKILGADHPDTISAASNFAGTYDRQGRFAEAEKLKLEVLEKRTKILGPNHPDTIQAAANLATTYRVQGRLAEAEKLNLEVLEKRTKLLGPDHLDTVQEADSLAWVYEKQGRFGEAEKLKLEVLGKRTKILGPDHPDTIWAASILATTYCAQGRLAEAEKLNLEVLEKRTKLQGPDHLETIQAATGLAWVYEKQGRFVEAEKLESKVLEKQTKILGPDHPDTIHTAASLAWVYENQGQFGEAEKLELEVLEKRTKILGPDHPDTVQAAVSLAVAYNGQGQFVEAEKLELKVLEKRTKLLGTDHPHTIDAVASLAITYSYQERWDEAGRLELEVLENRTKLLGPDHLDTVQAAASLAFTYYPQERWDEAAKLELEVLEKRTKFLGVEHPDTVQAAASLVTTYCSQGQFDEAERLEADGPGDETAL